MSQVNARFATRRPWEEVNDADKQEVIRALALGYSVQQAAKIVKRKPAVIFEWARADEGFAAALNAIAADKDDEVVEFRERVRRAAGTMLDHLLDLADNRINPVTLMPVNPARERNAAVKTFFTDVHSPVLLPKTASGPQTPTVMVNAAQAQFLIQGAPTNGHGESHASEPQTIQATSGDVRHDDTARDVGASQEAASVSAPVAHDDFFSNWGFDGQAPQRIETSAASGVCGA